MYNCIKFNNHLYQRMSNNSLNNTPSLKELDKLIKQAKKNEIRKKDALKKAQDRLEEAKAALYKLQVARDAVYLKSLNGAPDWDMVFNYNPNETDLAFHYRKQLSTVHNLINTGHYNPITQQHTFCIFFESDSVEELHQQLETTQLIFSKLLPNPDDEGRKCIVINNLLDVDDYHHYELAQDSATAKHFILVRRFTKIIKTIDFKGLEQALRYIQQKSNIAFESKENVYLLASNQSE